MKDKIKQNKKMKKKGTLFEPWYFQENGELNIARYIIGDTVREVEGKLYMKFGDSELYIPVKEIKDYERINYDDF